MGEPHTRKSVGASRCTESSTSRYRELYLTIPRYTDLYLYTLNRYIIKKSIDLEIDISYGYSLYFLPILSISRKRKKFWSILVVPYYTARCSMKYTLTWDALVSADCYWLIELDFVHRTILYFDWTKGWNKPLPILWSN